MLAVAGVNTAGTEEILASHWGKITLLGVALLLVLLAPQRGALGRGALRRGVLKRRGVFYLFKFKFLPLTEAHVKEKS